MVRSALKRCFQQHVSFNALQPRVFSQLAHGRVLVDTLPVHCVLETRWRMLPVGLLWLLFYTVYHSRIDNTKTLFSPPFSLADTLAAYLRTGQKALEMHGRACPSSVISFACTRPKRRASLNPRLGAWLRVAGSHTPPKIGPNFVPSRR